MPAKYVYGFGGGSAEGNGSQKDLLGGKGAGLAEMSRIGIPVPPGFTITTDACSIYQETEGRYPEGLEQEVEEHLQRLEEQLGQRFGDPQNPPKPTTIILSPQNDYLKEFSGRGR